MTLRLSQAGLAGMVGATRESVNKQLKTWQDVGVVRLGERLIEISGLPAIKRSDEPWLAANSAAQRSHSQGEERDEPVPTT